MTVRIAIILGGLVGAVLAVYTINFRKKAAKQEGTLSVSMLLKGQMIVETLGLQQIIDYIDQNKAESSTQLSYIVGRVTKETISMICVDKENSGKLISGNYYFIEAYKESYKPVWVKLINCHKVSDEVEGLLNKDDFVVIDGQV